jgi:hypothetical protein
VPTYDGAGNRIDTFTPGFFFTDTVGVLSLTPNGLLVARDTVNPGGTVSTGIIGQVSSLRTPTLTVYVTVPPTTLTRADTTKRDSIVVPLGPDSAGSIGTAQIATVVRGANGQAIPGIFVRYELETVVESRTSSPAAYLRDDGNRVFPAGQSTADTADASGGTSRTLVMNAKLVADVAALSDTLVVVVTTSYRGTPLTNAPLRIAVPVR